MTGTVVTPGTISRFRASISFKAIGLRYAARIADEILPNRQIGQSVVAAANVNTPNAGRSPDVPDAAARSWTRMKSGR